MSRIPLGGTAWSLWLGWSTLRGVGLLLMVDHPKAPVLVHLYDMMDLSGKAWIGSIET